MQLNIVTILHNLKCCIFTNDSSTSIVSYRYNLKIIQMHFINVFEYIFVVLYINVLFALYEKQTLHIFYYSFHKQV